MISLWNSKRKGFSHNRTNFNGVGPITISEPFSDIHVTHEQLCSGSLSPQYGYLSLTSALLSHRDIIWKVPQRLTRPLPLTWSTTEASQDPIPMQVPIDTAKFSTKTKIQYMTVRVSRLSIWQSERYHPHRCRQRIREVINQQGQFQAFLSIHLLMTITHSRTRPRPALVRHWNPGGRYPRTVIRTLSREDHPIPFFRNKSSKHSRTDDLPPKSLSPTSKLQNWDISTNSSAFKGCTQSQAID